MGLAFSSQSGKEYRAGYSGLHQIRYLAYIAAGGDSDYGAFMASYQSDTVERGIMYAHMAFPNLMWHSDCEGSYTRRGKISNVLGVNETLKTGNSIKLLKELRVIKENIKSSEAKMVLAMEYGWERFNQFYEVVEEIVEHEDGRIVFG